MTIRFGPVPKGFGSTKLEVDGFIKVYKEAFGGEPYFEVYSDDDVREIWDEHMADGRIILAKDEEANGKVVGFGCSLPLHHAPQNVQDFLARCMERGLLPADFSFENTWYMSELGVLEDYRKRGIAYELVRHRLIDVSHSGKRYYIMRTADERSNSRHLYEQLGALVVSEKHDVSDTEQVQEQLSQSVFRVYLYGNSRDALHALAQKLPDEVDVTETSGDSEVA